MFHRYFEEKDTLVFMYGPITFARTVTNDIASNEKRSIRDPKTLSFVIVFVRPVKRYQNVPTAKLR